MFVAYPVTAPENTAVSNIMCRKKSLFRLLFVVLVISSLISWTLILTHVNKVKNDAKKTGSDHSVIIANRHSSGRVGKSKQSQSILANYRNYGSVFVRHSLGETPKKVQKSVVADSEEEYKEETFVDEAKSRSPSRDHRKKTSAAFRALKYNERINSTVYSKRNKPGDLKSSNVGKTVHVFGSDHENYDEHVKTSDTGERGVFVKDSSSVGHGEKENNKTNSQQALTNTARRKDNKGSIGSRDADKDGNSLGIAVYEKLKYGYPNITRLVDVKGSRRSLLIVAPARTGSSFLGDAFNQHPDVFYLFEPLHGVNPPSHSNDAKSMQFLEGILRCKFQFGRYVREVERFRRYSSNALSSPPLCPNKTYTWSPRSRCVPLTPQNMEDVCKFMYSTTVLKILTSRIPKYNVESLFPICNSSNCAILYLVRDPRAIIFSHMKLGMVNWENIVNSSAYKDKPRPLVRLYSTQICEQMEANIKVFQNLPIPMNSRHYMIRYEDLAKDPTETLRRVYKMAALEMTNTTLQWVRRHTGEAKISETDQKNEFSTMRNSKAVIDKWRFEIDPCVVDVVEESCSSVMKILGYKPISRSENLQYDLNVSLSDG